MPYQFNGTLEDMQTIRQALSDYAFTKITNPEEYFRIWSLRCGVETSIDKGLGLYDYVADREQLENGSESNYA